MAEKIIKKKTPAMHAMAVLGSVQEGGKAKLKASMAKMAEDLTALAVSRECETRDQSELFVLKAALTALRAGDQDTAVRHLADRVALVERRAANRARDGPQDSDDDSDSDDEDAPPPVERSQPQPPDTDGNSVTSAVAAPVPAALPNVEDPVYWRGLVGELGLHVLEPMAVGQVALTLPPHASTSCGGCGACGACGAARAAAGSTEQRAADALPFERHRAELRQDGYTATSPVVARGLMARLEGGMRALAAAGWPPVFVFLFDETWHLVDAIWDAAQRLLGDRPVVLEPSFTAFRLQHSPAKGYVGTNFGLPHRDYSFADTYDAQGEARLLSVWFPLNDITLDNGCMYVVPREFDANFDRDHVHEHKQVMTQGGVQGKSFLHFGLNGIRPLPAQAGSILCWKSNIIHWGSCCSRRGAEDPRASLAFVFREASAAPDPECPPLRREEILSLAIPERLRLVTRALTYFKHWYSIPDHLKEILTPYATDTAPSRYP